MSIEMSWRGETRGRNWERGKNNLTEVVRGNPRPPTRLPSRLAPPDRNKVKPSRIVSSPPGFQGWPDLTTGFVGPHLQHLRYRHRQLDK